MNRYLLIVDPQNDFVTGSLVVKGTQESMENLSGLLKNNKEMYKWMGVTLDSHPINHCSFTDNGGVFPPHCVRFTWGAAICKELEQAFWYSGKLLDVSFYEKGLNPDTEEYSIFKNNVDGGKLKKQLEAACKENIFYELHVAGIAGDYCVFDTITDLIEAGIVPHEKIVVLQDGIASIDGGGKLQELIASYNLKTR